jgi:hypothetical protein
VLCGHTFGYKNAFLLPVTAGSCGRTVNLWPKLSSRSPFGHRLTFWPQVQSEIEGLEGISSDPRSGRGRRYHPNGGGYELRCSEPALAPSAVEDLEASVVPAQALARLSYLGPLNLGLDQQ